MPRILEAGHYYVAHGPTAWSVRGWSVLEAFHKPDDKTMLFVDDVHGFEDVHVEERKLPIVRFHPRVDYRLFESQSRNEALRVLEMLKQLSKRKRAVQKRTGMWFCSGFPITDASGNPLCVLLDAGLTLKKQEFGFQEGVNILPFYYASQQQQLLRLIRKAIPDFSLSVVLFDGKGKHWEMTQVSVLNGDEE